MTLFRIFTDVTGGSTIGIILLGLYFIIFVGTAVFLAKRLHSVISGLNLFIGIFVYFLISAFLSDFFLKVLLFPNGEYLIYGLGGGLFRMFSSIIVGLFIGYFATRLIYFKLVKKSN